MTIHQHHHDSCDHCEVCAIHEGWLFSRLGEEETAMLAGLARMIDFQRRQILHSEGETASQVLIVTRGVVKLTSVSPEGKVQVLGLVYPGQLVGIEAFFHDDYEMGATALTAGTACALPRDRLMRILRERPDFALQLLEAMHVELDQARARIQEMGKTSAESKICAILCDLLPHLGEQTPLEGDFPLAHSDLAEILGLSRETISRAVGGLAKRGVVSVSRHQVLVHDIERLRELAQ